MLGWTSQNNSHTLISVSRVCRRFNHKHVYGLTVTVVTGVDVSLQCFGLRELRQHFGQVARSLSGRLPAITVIPLGELKGQIPERLHGVGAMVAGQTRHLHVRRGKGNENVSVFTGDTKCKFGLMSKRDTSFDAGSDHCSVAQSG